MPTTSRSLLEITRPEFRKTLLLSLVLLLLSISLSLSWDYRRKPTFDASSPTWFFVAKNSGGSNYRPPPLKYQEAYRKWFDRSQKLAKSELPQRSFSTAKGGLSSIKKRRYNLPQELAGNYSRKPKKISKLPSPILERISRYSSVALATTSGITSGRTKLFASRRIKAPYDPAKSTGSLKNNERAASLAKAKKKSKEASDLRRRLYANPHLRPALNAFNEGGVGALRYVGRKGNEGSNQKIREIVGVSDPQDALAFFKEIARKGKPDEDKPHYKRVTMKDGSVLTFKPEGTYANAVSGVPPPSIYINDAKHGYFKVKFVNE